MSNEKIRTLSNSEGSEDALTPKQEQFCNEYVVDLSGTNAALRCGYSPKTAGSQSSRMLRNVNICKRIRQLVEERNKRTKINADTVLIELLKLAKSDVRKLFKENGALKEIKDLEDDIAPCISSIEIDELFEGSGFERRQVGFTKKIKLWDKTKALELLGKHLALFIDRVEEKSESTNMIKIDYQDKDL